MVAEGIHTHTYNTRIDRRKLSTARTCIAWVC